MPQMTFCSKTRRLFVMCLLADASRPTQALQAEQDPCRLVSEYKNAILKVTISGHNGCGHTVEQRFTGTAFLVSKSFALTAWHVVHNFKDAAPDSKEACPSPEIHVEEIYVGTKSKDLVRASVVSTEAEGRRFDFAILSLKAKDDWGSMELGASSHLKEAHPVCTAGFPDVMQPPQLVYSSGEISTTPSPTDKHFDWGLNYKSAPGQSGSPVMSGVTGLVVAMNLGKKNDRSDLMAALPLHHVRELVAARCKINIPMNELPDIVEFRTTDYRIGTDNPSADQITDRLVKLREFKISKRLVTNDEYKLVFKNHRPKNADPVVGVSWADANRYCQQKSDTNYLYTLPTEEEWEAAAAKGRIEMGNLKDRVLGEWTSDDYKPYDTSPRIAAKVVRGLGQDRINDRQMAPEDAKFDYVGFRVVVRTKPVTQ